MPRISLTCGLSGGEMPYMYPAIWHVLRQDVGVAALGGLVGRDVDVGGAQVEVGGGDGAHAPVCLGGVGLLLVRRGGGDDEFLAVDVRRLGGHRVELRRLLGLLLDLGDLLRTFVRKRGVVGVWQRDGERAERGAAACRRAWRHASMRKGKSL
eukprot:6199219-Pleurochrysis_carterae.AAC.2